MGSLMDRSRLVISTAATAALWASQLFAADKVNYQDHVLPIFRNSCLNCHNPDKKKAGLDLSTYSAALAGSNNGTVINSGDPDGSLLYKVVTHAEDPTMPPKKDKLPDKELNIIKAWIAAGALDTATGKAAVSSKPKIDLTVASSGLHKPDGPPPMPRDLLPEPVVRADRPWAVGCMASSPWAPVVAIGGQHQVLLYNTDTLDLLGIIPFTEGEPQVVQFSRNGQILLIGGGVAGKSGKVSLWNVTTGQKLTDVGEEFDSVLAADISPDQTLVALGGPTKVFKVYSTRDGSLVHTTKKHTDWVTAAGYSPDGVLLASGDRAGGLWVWESKNGSEFYNLAGHKAGVSSVAFRDDSNFLASASEDGTVKLWDMTSGKEVKTWQAHGGGVLSVSFTHDGRLVTCGRDKTVKLWQADGTQIRQFDAFTDIALHAAFDSQGKRVIAGDWTGELRVWDAAEGKLVGHLSSNPAPLAERLTGAEKHAVELQTLSDKANADASAARQAADKAAAEQKAAEDNLVAAKKAIESAQARAKSADDAVQSAKVQTKALETAILEKQTAVDQAGKTRDVAIAARDASQKERKTLEDAVVEKQKSSEVAAQSATVAQSEAAAKSDDAQLASKAKEQKEAADKAAQELDAAKVALKTKVDQIPPLNDTAAKAESELVRAKEALATAKKTLADQGPAGEKLRAARAEAQAAIPKAQADATAAEKSIAPKVAQTKAAQAQAMTARAAADAAAQQVAAAKLEITRLKLGQVYVTVYNARQELLANQAELDRLNASAHAGQTDVDNTVAAITSAKKAMADAPNQIKEQEAAVAKAKETITRVTGELQAVQGALTQKQALLADATELSKKLSFEASKSPADQTLNDAATKARATVESLTANVEAAKRDAAAKAEAVKTATSTLTTAEAALTKAKSDMEAIPRQITTLEQTATAATAEEVKRKTAADAAAKTLAAIKTKVDQLNADYQKKSQEAGMGAQATASGKS